MIIEACGIPANEQLAAGIWRLTVSSSKIAPQVQPGQFVHLQIPEHGEHILRRPFSVYDVAPKAQELRIVYQVVGAGTALLTQCVPGASSTIDVLGPIGHGWSKPTHLTSAPATTKSVLLIGGGIGAAPLKLFAQDLQRGGLQVDVILGATTASMLVFSDDFAAFLSREHLHCCTDDGSAGTKGFTTTLARELLSRNAYDLIASCGPAPMQKAVSQLAFEFGVCCQVSLEERMACGIGACLGCTVNTTGGRKRVCVDGPVFDAGEVIW
jgi:dihydroorotate dehydrogenase electron transfer subunit